MSAQVSELEIPAIRLDSQAVRLVPCHWLCQCAPGPARAGLPGWPARAILPVSIRLSELFKFRAAGSAHPRRPAPARADPATQMISGPSARPEARGGPV